MTISRVEVNEYTCLLCDYKWINRRNGKDGPIPKRCAKCKKLDWNGKKTNPMTPQEAGLRRRITNLYKLYHIAVWRMLSPLPDFKTFSVDDYLNKEVVLAFLMLENPRPTISELQQVLYPPGLALGLNSQNFVRMEAWYPDPQKPGWFKRDKSPYNEYLKHVKADALKQQQAMQKIIDERIRKEQELKVEA